MLLWIIPPILLYFFKINLLVVFLVLSIIDLLRGRSLTFKFIQPESITTYYDKEGILRYCPKEKWFSNGIKEIVNYQKIGFPMFPVIFIYKILIMACYHDFSNFKVILMHSLLLTISTFLGEIVGQIIAIKEIISFENNKK